ncbi:MAG: PH domain-containing protein [Maribacter sp.]|nr:PH domain-containing protein [Maribacter sp.]
MTVYKSKIGLSIVLLLVLVLGTTSYLMIKDGAWLGLLLNILVALVIGYIFIQTRYTIKGDILIVKCTFLINKSYEIKRITKITETNNPLSAPAASLDRLEINFDNYDSVLISPKQKSEFISHLKILNPNIVVTLKK